MAFKIVAALCCIALTVQAKDTQRPIIKCPPSIEVKSKDSSETVFWPFPTADDDSGVPPIGKCSKNSGDAFPTPSVTRVKCEATDGAGNTDSCSFEVHVKDVAQPVFTFCPKDKEITAKQGRIRLFWDNPKTTDNSGLPPRIFLTHRKGMEVKAPATIPITYKATDNSGNTAFCSFVIKVTVEKCKLYSPPVNGAASCFESHGNIACTVSCNDRFEFDSNPALVYYCSNAISNTFPFGFPLQWPSCKAKAAASKMMPLDFYYKGDANDPNVILKLKQNGKTRLSSPSIPPFFCLFNQQCVAQNFKVYAGKVNPII